MSLSSIAFTIQASDSAFPVGTFSFSNGLESASFASLVTDAESLEQYARSASLQAAFSDGVTALTARRAFLEGDYDAAAEADRRIMLFKMNDETRLMLARMGKKLAELTVRLFHDSKDARRLLDDINSGSIPGSYPVSQGLWAALTGMSAEELFMSHQYGVINMVLSAALRCVRVSHYDTQRILLKLCREAEGLFEHADAMTFEDLNSFVPEMDIMASLHEKGNMRMFMN